jgi:DNA-directed RNA polymerase specialized sigma24 family protein
VIEELANMLEQDSLPPDMLEKLGTDRDALTEFIDRYRRERERMAEQEPLDVRGTPQSKGRVADSTGPAAEDVTAGDGLPATTDKDTLRSRFEGASDRLSPRYRDVVDRYYQQLSRE